MTTYSFYRLADGEFLTRRVTCPPARIAQQTPEGCAAIEGAFDPVHHVYSNGRVADRAPPAPPEPTLDDLKAARAKPLIWAIARHEAGQGRAQRELLLALAAGQSAPTAATSSLADIEAAIEPLRATLAAIAACTTQSELDAIP